MQLKGIPLEKTPFAPPHVKTPIKEHGLWEILFGDSVTLDNEAKPLPELPEPMKFRLKPEGAVLKGHLASDPKHAQYPSARYALRSYFPTPAGELAVVDFRDLFKSAGPAYPSQRYTVTSKEISKAVKDTGAVRSQQLTSGKLVAGDRVVPKDGALNPENFAIYLNSASDVSFRYAEQLSQIGKLEGFHVVAGGRNVNSEEKELKKGGYDNLSYLTADGGEAWVEDYGEPTLAGGRVCPAIFSDSGDQVPNWIAQGRQERFTAHGLDGHFAFHGAVNQGKFQPYCLAQGLAEKGSIRQALSYMEGGNIMPGTNANGDGFVLVGKDSFHVSRRLLEKQTGKQWSVEDTKRAIAADLGLKPENVHGIEQPGAFHLDMRMTQVAPGEFLLNDSVAACKQQIEWLKRDLADRTELSAEDRTKLEGKLEERSEAMLKQAKLMARYEALTAADLEGAGMKVHRAPGVFVDTSDPGRDVCNFFNVRHGTNESGERFTILMGSTPRHEAFFAPKLFEASGGEISRMHFLDPKVSQTTLDMMGGLKCRTKPEGELVSQALLNEPVRAQLTPA